jgi:hypothetical protein
MIGASILTGLSASDFANSVNPPAEGVYADLGTNARKRRELSTRMA